MAFTYFFRDMQTLQMICDHCMPELKTRQKVKIWDAGSAMGPEPYSLSMMIREQTGPMYFRNIKIVASDIDISNTFRETIQNAEYPREMIERVDSKYISKYFTPLKEKDHYKISDEIRNSLEFVRHDLLSLKPVGDEFGLIVCKNVLLHFSELERISVLKMFYESLSDGGFLAMEQTQKMPYAMQSYFEPVVSNAQIYRKVKDGE